VIVISTVAQISLDNTRENQLADIQERRKDVPRGASEAVKFLLFEYMEKLLGVKKKERKV